MLRATKSFQLAGSCWRRGFAFIWLPNSIYQMLWVPRSPAKACEWSNVFIFPPFRPFVRQVRSRAQPKQGPQYPHPLLWCFLGERPFLQCCFHLVMASAPTRSSTGSAAIHCCHALRELHCQNWTPEFLCAESVLAKPVWLDLKLLDISQLTSMCQTGLAPPPAEVPAAPAAPAPAQESAQQLAKEVQQE